MCSSPKEWETNSLELCALEELRGKKNLLAFSAGVDSTALFFLLMEIDIDFDIAIVDYNLRSQSKEEVAYAKDLAKKYGKKCFVKEVHLPHSNIEAGARKVRYAFFETLIQEHGYHNLITAHHLGDQLEWFLMQLAKGAGLVELVGMEPLVDKKSYTLVRPLLFVTKEELRAYLQQHDIRYFEDSSNYDESFERNFIRHQFSEPFLEHFSEGVKRSFRYLLEDKKLLQLEFEEKDGLLLAKRPKSTYESLRLLRQMFKAKGYLLSSAQLKEILRQQEGVIAGKIAFALTPTHIYVAPYITHKLSKEQKERFRRLKIPPPLRGFLAQKGILLPECKE